MGQERRRGLRDEGVAEPPVGQLAGEPHVGRADGGDVDRHVHRGRHGPDGPVAGPRQLVDLALVIQPVTAADHPDDLDRFPRRPDWFSERDTMPALHDLGSADAEAQHEPPAGKLLRGHRGHGQHGGGSRAELHDRGAQADRRRPGGEVADLGERVVAPHFRDPGRVHAEPFGLSDKVDGVRRCGGGLDREAEGTARCARRAAHRAGRHPASRSASSLIPVTQRSMFAWCSARRRAMIRSSLPGIASMAGVRPDGPGPSVAHCRR